MVLFHAISFGAGQRSAAGYGRYAANQRTTHQINDLKRITGYTALMVLIAVFLVPVLVAGQEQQTCYNLPAPTCGSSSSMTPPEERCYPQVTNLVATLQRVDTLSYTPLQMRLLFEVHFEGHGFHHTGQTPFQMTVTSRVDDWGPQNVGGWSSQNDLAYDAYSVCYPIAQDECYSVIVQGSSQQVKFWAVACEVNYQGYCTCQCQTDTVRIFGPWVPGARDGLYPPPISELGPPECESQAGDPINVTNGNVFLQRDDIILPSDRGPSLLFGRYYNSLDTSSSDFGSRWRHSFEYTLARDPNGSYQLTEASGRKVFFRKRLLSTGETQRIVYDPPLSIPYRLRQDTISGLISIILPDERRLLFEDTGTVDFIEDLAGNRVSLFHSGTLLDSLENASGRRLVLTYASGKLQAVRDASGNALATYSYDPDNGLLGRVTYADSSWEQYDHGVNSSDQDKITRVTTSDGATVEYTYLGTGGASGFRRGSDEGNPEYEGVTLAWYLPPDTLGCAASIDTQFCVLTYQDGSADTLYFQWLRDKSHRRVIRRPNASCSSCGTSYSYNAQGQKATVTFANGTSDSMWYDSRGNLIRSLTGANTPAVQAISFAYDSSFNYPTAQARSSVARPSDTARTLFTYDGQGNLTRVINTGWRDSTHAFSDTSRLVYNAYGQLLHVDGVRTDVADTVVYAYYANGDRQLEILANGDTTRYGQRDEVGRSTWVRFSNGDTLRLGYDARGRLTSIVSLAGTSDSTVVHYTYTVANDIATATYPGGRQWINHYNRAGHMDTLRDPAGSFLAFEYDSLGNSTSQRIHGLGHVLRYQQALGYDERHQPIWAAGPYNDTTRFGYSPTGMLNSIQNALGHTVTAQYDWLNRPVATVEPRVNDSIKTIYEYDAHNNITAVTDPDGLRYSFAYDDGDRLIRDSSPSSGVTAYGYDAADNLVFEKNAAGDSIVYRYDALNRVTAALYPDSQNVRYYYDSTVYAFGRGRLYREAAPACTTTYRYDQLGRILQEMRRLPGDTLTYTTGYSYDANDNVTSITYPSGVLAEYQYDLADNVTLVRCSTEGAWDTLASNITYAPMGEAEFWQLGNGIQMRNHYDLRYLIDSLNTGADSIAKYCYTYDAVGEIDSLRNCLDTLASRGFDYDYIGQITDARSKDYPDTLVEYVYSRGGSREKEIRYQSPADTTWYAYASGRLGHISSQDSLFRYTYDQLGRLIREVHQSGTGPIILPPIVTVMSSEGAGPGPDPNPHRPDTVVYQYNDAGQLTSVHNQGSAAFGYDGLGRRIKKVWNTVPTVFIPGESGEVLSEYWNSQSQSDYIYLNGRPLARVTNGSLATIQYYINDHLGTPVALVNNQKTIQWRADWYPFGEVYDELTTSFSHMRFPGQWRDVETNLSYNWHRYYNPRTGRYTQPDPLGIAGGLNVYSYAGGNPLSYGDADGQNPILVAYAAYEILQSAFDIYEAVKSLFDPCATWEERGILWGGAVAGLYLPGGGYGRGARAVEKFHRHHMIPWEFKAMVPKGIDINDYRKLVPEWMHNTKPFGIHTGTGNYNALWRDFFQKHPSASRAQVLEFMHRMEEQFHLTTLEWVR